MSNISRSGSTADDWKSKPLSRPFRIPNQREGSVKNNESEIVVLRNKLKKLEERIEALEA